MLIQVILTLAYCFKNEQLISFDESLNLSTFIFFK